MVDSPLSRAARMVKNKVPALGEEILRGAGSLVDAWTTEAEAEACGDTSDAATESGTGRQVMTQDWIQQRTRDELEDLLLQADRVIRERERGPSPSLPPPTAIPLKLGVQTLASPRRSASPCSRTTWPCAHGRTP